MNRISVVEFVPILEDDEYWMRFNAFIKELYETPSLNDLDNSLSEEDLKYFLSQEYRNAIDAMCTRDIHPVKRVRFMNGNIEVGFCEYCVYDCEDGKAFILEFFIYKQYRGRGLGTVCFNSLKENVNAKYFELNTSSRLAMNFWKKQGFIVNGYDEHNVILLCTRPNEKLPIAVRKLEVADFDWQFHRIMTSFKRSIGETPISELQIKEVVNAVESGNVVFFGAYRECRLVGMVSVSMCYSTFSFSNIGVIDDFYIEPVFRNEGIAKTLLNEVFRYCEDEGMTSVIVISSKCDVEMYNHLGFDFELGFARAKLM